MQYCSTRSAFVPLLPLHVAVGLIATPATAVAEANLVMARGMGRAVNSANNMQ